MKGSNLKYLFLHYNFSLTFCRPFTQYLNHLDAFINEKGRLRISIDELYQNDPRQRPKVNLYRLKRFVSSGNFKYRLE